MLTLSIGWPYLLVASGAFLFMNNGWIKLHKKFIESPVWLYSVQARLPQLLQLWMHLLLSANFEEKKWYDGQQENIIPAGSLITSQKHISETLDISRTSVRTCLSHLVKMNMITIKVTNKWTQVWIVNWGKYQSVNSDSNQQADHRITNDKTSTEHQLNTTKEYKDIKNTRILTNVNRTSPFGSEEINLVIGEFSKRLGRIPADKYPRKVAQNSRQVINGFIKRQGKVFSKVRGTELTFSYVLEKSWDWYMSKDYALKTEKLESYHSRLRVFIADKEKQLETEGRRS